MKTQPVVLDTLHPIWTEAQLSCDLLECVQGGWVEGSGAGSEEMIVSDGESAGEQENGWRRPTGFSSPHFWGREARAAGEEVPFPRSWSWMEAHPGPGPDGLSPSVLPPELLMSAASSGSLAPVPHCPSPHLVICSGKERGKRSGNSDFTGTSRPDPVVLAAEASGALPWSARPP